MAFINGSGLNYCDVSNQQAPPEGPKSIPVPLDFSAASLYSLQFGNLQQTRNFSMVQGIFVDNSLNGSALTVQFQSTGQSILCPANSQGYFTVLCANPINIDFSSNGGASATVQLLNFPVATAVWHV